MQRFVSVSIAIELVVVFFFLLHSRHTIHTDIFIGHSIECGDEKCGMCATNLQLQIANVCSAAAVLYSHHNFLSLLVPLCICTIVHCFFFLQFVSNWKSTERYQLPFRLIIARMQCIVNEMWELFKLIQYLIRSMGHTIYTLTMLWNVNVTTQNMHVCVLFKYIYISRIFVNRGS